MRNRMRICIAACFYYSGLVKLTRWWMRRSGRELLILNYHRASGGDLRRHLLYLRRHYRILHLEQALEELYRPAQEGLCREDRRPLLVMTFDDGYYDNYTHAFPLVCELQTPITIFLIPGYIESGNHFWWLEGHYLVQHAQTAEVTIEGRTYHLNHQGEREALAQLIYDHAYYARSVAEREAFLSSMRQTLAADSSLTLEDELAQPLTWAQVREMEESGWVSLGAHTLHHPSLAFLTSLDEMMNEVAECRAVLEQQLGHPVRTFAYPLGKPEQIGDNAPTAVRQAGYDWAVTTLPGFNTPRTDPYLLRRLNGSPDQYWLIMAAETAGIWGFFSRLLRTRLAPALKSLLAIF
jgi:peptidoglycan/xylan/chitin deacetylase (PgdA/CDA1 family)